MGGNTKGRKLWRERKEREEEEGEKRRKKGERGKYCKKGVEEKAYFVEGAIEKKRKRIKIRR